MRRVWLSFVRDRWPWYNWGHRCFVGTWRYRVWEWLWSKHRAYYK